jgi:hypothetical protein
MNMFIKKSLFIDLLSTEFRSQKWIYHPVHGHVREPPPAAA